MPESNKTGAAGLEILKRNEGCRLTAYQDIVGVWTIGYGDTGPDVQSGLVITQDEADSRLADRLAREFEPGVQAAIGDAPTTQNQFDAMVSLAYNIGVGGFKGSTVAHMHKAGRYEVAADGFLMWNKAGGRVVAGLVRRREEERSLYLAGGAILQNDPAAALKPLDALKRVQETMRDAGTYKAGIDGAFGRQSRQAMSELLRLAGQRGI